MTPSWRPWRWSVGHWLVFGLVLTVSLTLAYDLDQRAGDVTAVRRGEAACYLTRDAGWIGCDGDVVGFAAAALVLAAVAYATATLWDTGR